MSDSIRHHLTSFAVLAAVLGIPIYAEFMAQGLQIFRGTQGTLNEPLLELTRRLGVIATLISFCFAIAGLFGFGTNRRLAWPVTIIALGAALVLFIFPQAGLGALLSDPYPWFWFLGAGFVAMIFPLFKLRRLSGRIWTVLPLIAIALLGIAMVRFSLFGDGAALGAGIMTETGLVLGLAAPIILALILSATKSAGLIHALIAFGTLVLALAVGWASYRLGLEGTPMGYSEVALDAAGDAFILACAMLGLSLLVLGTAIWASQTQNELPD